MYDKNLVKKLIDNAYQTYKLDLFYDNFMVIYKREFSKFENNKDYKKRLERLVDFLCNLFNGYDDSKYINDLLDDVTYMPIIKKMDKKDTTLNYFIIMPVELFLLDYAWCLLFASNKTLGGGNNNHIYGNLLAENLIGLDYFTETLRNQSLFKRYMYGYNKWLVETNNAYIINNEVDDVTYLNLDFKRFYYSVTNPMSNFLVKHDTIVSEPHKKISLIINEIHKKYCLRLSNVSNLVKANEEFLPIGLPSSKILSNELLKDFDNEVSDLEICVHYGRYVDDTLFLFKGKHEKEVLTKEIEIILQKVLGQKKLSFNINKIKHMFIPRGSSKDVVTRLLKTIKASYYEENDEDSSALDAYFFLERKLLNNNLHKESLDVNKLLTFDIGKLLLVINIIFENIILDVNTARTIKRRIKNEVNYLNKPFVIYMATKFMLKYYTEEIEGYYKLLFDNISEVDNLILQDVRKDKLISTQRKLKKVYKGQVNTAFNLVYNFNFILEKTHHKLDKSGFVRKEKLIKQLIKDIRSNNNLSSVTTKKHYGNSLQFVHYHEIHLYYSFLSAILKKEFKVKPYKLYFRHNKIKHFTMYKEIKEKVELGSCKYTKKTIELSKHKVKKYLIENEGNFILSQPNINIKDDDINELIKLTQPPTLDETMRFLKLLNIARENNTNLLVLPEAYVRIEWIDILLEFARIEKMGIIYGVSPIIHQKKYFNFIGQASPFRDLTYHKYLYAEIREKNDYSYDEIRFCRDYGYNVNKTKSPLYLNIITPYFASTAYLCFEITDIVARSLFKRQTDLIGIPMLNKDTTYFNNIIESLSRDTSTIVATSNSAIIGNTVVALPKKTHSKILTEFIGGYNEYIVSSRLPLNSLRTFNASLKTEKDLEFKPHPARYF